MNFLEMITSISERGEISVSEKINSIRTDKFLYLRGDDGNWEQMLIPPFVEPEKFLPIVPTEVREKVKK